MSAADDLMTEALADYRHGWSIGTFGAIGEFVRGKDEPFRTSRGAVQEIITPRGGLRITSGAGLQIVAYDTLSSDGETWNQAVAFCLPRPEEIGSHGIRRIGPDTGALNAEDRDAVLFDLGVADPQTHSWPATRRGRAQARITLRRLVRSIGEDRLSAWRTVYDRAPADEEDAAGAAAATY